MEVTTSAGARVRAFFLGAAAETKEERRLVQKLDFFIMTYCCLSYFFNFLDRAAFANAYVAGLRESLDMNGQQYSTVLALTTAGMAVGQLPNGFIIQKIAPRIWFPSMVVVWAGLTMASAAVKTVTHMYVIRFLLGLAESSTYAGTIYIIGSWYKPDEIAKRTALFTASGQVGTMFAGIMMTAIHRGMNGMGNLHGWQWVFLIDGIITLPIAVFGFLYFPDTPDRTKAGYLSAEERKMAVARLPPISEDGHNVMPLSVFKRVFMSPVFWIIFFWSPVCAAIEGFPIQNNFLLWLKYNKDSFTQAQINTYPLGIQAVGIVSNMLAAWHMDVSGTRIPTALLILALQVMVGAMLLVRNLSFAGTFVAFYISGTAYAVNPTIFGWANIILQRSGDDAMRSITLYSMNIGSMVLWSFWGLLFYSGADTPYWFKGCIALLCSCFVMFCYMGIMWKLDRYTAEKYKDRMPGAVEPEGKLEEPFEPTEKQVPDVSEKTVDKTTN
ncbi:pantothenate transporter liz1 [Plectosphaerella cucumerina]|uniref:Pantothenate transporter liz1 n=1 Tax=Plectosphaerella cucumerina TaxID=40658 RepID=A0A8K0TKQ1_9PEZI|nr:pantothenate transporter liz1 [Plectosphaerella cucumerina]